MGFELTSVPIYAILHMRRCDGQAYLFTVHWTYRCRAGWAWLSLACVVAGRRLFGLFGTVIAGGRWPETTRYTRRQPALRAGGRQLLGFLDCFQAPGVEWRWQSGPRIFTCV